jgi:hypothetical protein
MRTLLIFLFPLLLFSCASSMQSRAPASENDAWMSLSGLKHEAADYSTDAEGKVHLEAVKGSALELLRSHLAQVKAILKARGDTFEDHGTWLELNGGNSRLGKFVAETRARYPATLAYSPFELLVIGADAAYGDLEKQLQVSAGSVISGLVDTTTLHERLHLEISENGISAPDYFRFIFFVTSRKASLRKDATYYSTFLRADEILTHIFEAQCLARGASVDEEDLEMAMGKVEALLDILQTLEKITGQIKAKGYALAALPTPLRKGQPVFGIGKNMLLDTAVALPKDQFKKQMDQLIALRAKLRPLAEAARLGGPKEISELAAGFERIEGAWAKSALERCN